MNHGPPGAIGGPKGRERDRGPINKAASTSTQPSPSRRGYLAATPLSLPRPPDRNPPKSPGSRRGQWRAAAAKGRSKGGASHQATRRATGPRRRRQLAPGLPARPSTPARVCRRMPDCAASVAPFALVAAEEAAEAGAFSARARRGKGEAGCAANLGLIARSGGACPQRRAPFLRRCAHAAYVRPGGSVSLGGGLLAGHLRQPSAGWEGRPGGVGYGARHHGAHSTVVSLTQSSGPRCRAPWWAARHGRAAARATADGISRLLCFTRRGPGRARPPPASCNAVGGRRARQASSAGGSERPPTSRPAGPDARHSAAPRPGKGEGFGRAGPPTGIPAPSQVAAGDPFRTPMPPPANEPAGSGRQRTTKAAVSLCPPGFVVAPQAPDPTHRPAGPASQASGEAVGWF